MDLTLYADFNCPFCARASARVDVLLAAGTHEVSWRAIQHDATIPPGGEAVDGDLAAALEAEVARVFELREPDIRLRLIVPPVRSNTALASQALAGAGQDADRLRRRLFAAVWAEGVNVSDAPVLRQLGAERLDADVARRWQDEFEALPRPITPSLVLPDGYTSRGVGALTRLAKLATPALSA
jgi:predicted DsbA family dithiol-disulfide isomerase